MERAENDRTRDRRAGRGDVAPSPAFRILLETPLLTIGRFQADPRHPLFHDSGPARWTSFVFPHRAVRIVRASGERIVATPNVVTYYNVGDEYRREAIDPAGDEGDFFALSPTLLLPLVERARRRAAVDPERPFRESSTRSDPRTYLAQRVLTRELARGTAVDGLLAEEAALRFIDRLLRVEPARGLEAASAMGGTASQRRALVEKAAELLAERFRENLTLVDLAREVGASPAHLTRLFQIETGTSLHQFRLGLRLRRALDLVVDPLRDLTDVALELGFSSHSHFTWAFGRAFGISPSKFRSVPASRRRREIERILDSGANAVEP